MKNHVVNALKAISVMAFVAAVCVFADSVPKVIVKVPFDFMVSNHILGAGDYSLNIDLSHSAVRINNDDGSSMFVLTYAAEANSVQRYAKLVFHRYGDRYFLSQVWVPGTTAGRELPPSKAEQEIARAHGKPELVALLAGGTKAPRSAR